MISDISSKTLKRFFEASPIPLTLSSPIFDDCPLVLANDAFLEMSGYERDEIIGRNCRFLQGPETDALSRAKLRHAVETKSEALVAIINYRKCGSLFENYVFLLPVFGRDGALLYFLGSQYDMTRRANPLSPLEHAQMLDETLETAGAKLAREDNLKVLASAPCTEAIDELISGR